MGNTILIRRGTTAPTAGSFAAGEPAWDASASKLYVKNNAGAMVCINPIASPADDSLVVHIAGTETITGAKTFSAAVVASTSVQSPEFYMGSNSNNRIRTTNSGLNIELFTVNTGYGVVLNGFGGSRLGINNTVNPSGWLDVRNDSYASKLLVNAAGRTLINTTTDDGSNQLQVSGAASISGVVTCGNGLTFDTNSGSRIFSGSVIRYQSNNSSTQHIFENQVGTSLASGSIVAISPGGAGVGSGVDLIRFLGTAGQTLAKVAATGAITAMDATFYGNNTATVTVGTFNGSVSPYNYTILRNTSTGYLEAEGNQSGYVGYKFRASGTDLVTINESTDLLTVHGDYRAVKFASTSAGNFHVGWTPGGSYGMQGHSTSSLVMTAGYYNVISAGIGNQISSSWLRLQNVAGTSGVTLDYTTDTVHVKSLDQSGYGDVACRNLTANGTVTGHNLNAYYVSRTVDTAANSYVNIGTVSHTDGIGSVPIRVELRDHGSGQSGSHVYFYTPNYDGTAGLWRQVLPISSSGPRGGSYILEVNSSGNSILLRVRRLVASSVVAALDITVSLIKGAVFTASTTTGTESSPSSLIASSSMLTQVGGAVVIGRSTVDGTGASLQVSGNVSISGKSTLKTVSGSDVVLTVDGSSGGQTANLTNWGSGTPLAYVDTLGRIVTTYDFRAPAIRTIDESSALTIGKSYKTIIQTNNSNTILFEGGVNQSTYLRSYQSAYPVIIADDGGATTFGGNISCKIITSSVSSGNNVGIINAASNGEAGFFFQHAGVSKWELYSAAGTSFGLYNYTTTAAAVTISAADSSMILAGSLTVSGSSLTCGVISSAHASSNNNMSLSAGSSSEVGILFKSVGTSKYQLYSTNADGSFRLYNFGTSSEALHVTSAGDVLLKAPTTQAVQIWTDAGLLVRNTANGADAPIKASTIKLTASPTVGYVWKCTNVDGSASWQAESGSGGGVADGDKGDITVSSSGTVWTIDNSAVTLAKIANIATATFLGRNTASSGVVEELSVATAKTMLGLTGTNSGDQTITLTGDVTGSGTGSFATTIANNAVSLAKFQQIATASILGRNTASTGNVEVLSASTVKSILSLNNVENTALSTWAGSTNVTTVGTIATGTWNATAIADGKIASALTGKTYNGLTLTAQTVGFTIAGGTTSKTLTVANDASVAGTNTGDQTITLTGDVTGSGTGSFAATIAAGAVSLSKMANMATASFLGRNTAGTGSPEVLSVSTAKSLLNLTGTNSGDQTISLTGDVTGSGTGSFAATIASNAVTLAKFQQIATASILGRTTASTGNVEVLTAAQVVGLILPSQTSNSGKVLGTDGTNLSWVTNGSGGSVAGSNTQVQFNNSGAFGASANFTWNNGTNQLGVAGTILATGTIGGSNLSGTNTGDQTITLTGDVTGSGTGSFAATIANSAVTLAKMANMATASFIGRNTAGTGAPEVLSVSTAKSLLNLTGTNSGDQTITLTGDVTGSGTGSFAATIANSAVSNAKMANMATETLKGRISAGSGAPEDLTITQARKLLRRAKYTIATPGSSYTLEVTNGLYQITTLTANWTLNFPTATAPEEGDSVFIYVKQPSSGGPRTLSLGSGFQAPGGRSNIVLSTAANAVDRLEIFFDSATTATVTITRDIKA